MFERSKFWIVAIAAAALLSAPAIYPGLHARADQSEQSPAEMLQDGLDALDDHERNLATQVFEQLILAFPGTPEADRAEQELAALNSGKRQDDEPDVAAPVASNARAIDTAVRLKFASEAGDRVFFAEDSAVIGGRARALIEHQARWLSVRPDIKITVIGRADDGASAEVARDLSNKRAEAVRDKLVGAGIPANRITIDARGSDDPVATCNSPICQAQNRQAETLITVKSAGDELGEATLPPPGVRGRGTAVGGTAGGVTVSR